MDEPVDGGCEMADRAFGQAAGVPLELNKLDGIVGFAAGGNGVGAVVAAFAVDAAHARGQLVKRVVHHETQSCIVSVACGAVASGFVQPGISVCGDLG